MLLLIILLLKGSITHEVFPGGISKETAFNKVYNICSVAESTSTAHVPSHWDI